MACLSFEKVALNSNRISKLKWAVWCFLIAFFHGCSSNDTPIRKPESREVDFVHTYGGSKNDVLQAVTKTSDGGYIVLGYTQSTDGTITDKTTEGFDVWVMKFDSEDVMEWSKTYGGSLEDRGMDIIQTSDGGYAILGFNKSNDQDTTENAGLQDYWIAKLNSSGSITWQKSFGFSGNDFGISLIQTSDGGYLLTGVLDVTASGGEGNSAASARKHAGGDYWVIKLDATGNKKWSKFYGGTFTDTPYGVVETEDNGFLIAGSSDSSDVDISGNKGTYDFWLIKITATGEMVWEKSYGGSQIDEAWGIVSSGDGNYVMVGSSRSSDNDVSQSKGAADVWVVKINPSGDMIWEKSYGGSDFDVGRTICKTSDNGFLVIGSSRSSDGNLSVNHGQNDAWIFNIDQNGTMKWEKTIGGSQIDFGYDIVELGNKAIIAVGESGSSDVDIPENKGFTDALLIKIKQKK